MTKVLKIILSYIKLSSIKIDSKEIVLICAYGIGDTYFTCALAEEISKKYRGNVSVLVKQNHYPIAQLFKKNLKRIMVFDGELIRYTKLFGMTLKKGAFFYAHPTTIFYPRKIRLMGFKINLLDSYKILFGLKENTGLSSPKYNLKNLNLGKKTCFLAPESSSISELPLNFWLKVYRLLVSLGYEVLINTTKKEYQFDSKNNNYNLDDIPNLVNNCDLFVSARSGICDLVAETNTKKVIIYKDEEWYDGTTFSGSSFKGMNFGSNFKEIIFLNTVKTLSDFKKLV